ncbi:MAG: hypothetical protein JSW73_02320 [Candidatus Woesearchaeota archaeon]|nr:MAG: hypothetical protein JSW73_02320 [Candidatus Woesearchaeota archaeon]
MALRDKASYAKNQDDVSSNSYIAKHTASFLGKAYIATYMLNVVGRAIHPDHTQIIPSIVEDGNIDKLIFAIGATVPYTTGLYLSKFNDKLKNFIIDIKYHASRNKVTDFLVNNESVNRGFSTFTVSFLGLLGLNQMIEWVPALEGNTAALGNRTPDILHFSAGVGIGGYFSDPKDKLSKRIGKSLAGGLILSGLWEGFEHLGERVFGFLSSDIPGGMTSDTLQDMVNVEIGAGVSPISHPIYNKIKDKIFKKKDLEEIL